MKSVIYHELPSPKLTSTSRRIRVYLPSEYDHFPSQRYPVLYMHDGQNIMDPAKDSGYSWNAANIIEELVQKGEMEPIILVGIDHGDHERIAEYTRSISEQRKKKVEKYLHQEFVPKGKYYQEFLLETVKTFVDSEYRTKPQREFTAMAGSSCGGNISLQIYLANSKVFSKIGIFSPALWIIDSLLHSEFQEHQTDSCKIYIDMGGKESKFLNCWNIQSVKRLRKRFISVGYPPQDVMLVIDRLATHTELFWQARFSGFLQFIYNKGE